MKLWSRSISSWCILSIVVKMLSIYFIHTFYLPKAFNWLVELSTLFLMTVCETVWENTDLVSIRNVSSALVSVPIRLPRHKNLLTMPYAGEMHPLQRIKVVACFVSDDHSRMMAFQSWMQKSYRLYEMK